MNRVEWKSESRTITFYADDQVVGSILPFDHAGIDANDEVTLIDEGVYKWVRNFHVNALVSDAALHMDFHVAKPMSYGMIPAVSYNGNPWGPGRDIKGFMQNGEPWTFAYHRVAVSGGTYSESSDWSIALFAQEGFRGSCTLIPSDSMTIHRLLLAEIEAPQVYSARDTYSTDFKDPVLIQAGTRISIVAYLVLAPVLEPRQAWCRMLDIAWQQHVYQHQPRIAAEKLWEWGVHYIKHSLWTETDAFQGLSIGLYWENDHWVQHDLYEIGWCGQNASMANALLYDYVRNGTRSSLDKGLMTLDFWATHAALPNGLFRCHFGHVDPSGTQHEEVQDGCNLGAAAVYFFEAHQLALQCGNQRSQYQQVAMDICDFFVEHQFEDGNLGRAWRNNGDCVATDGATGSFLIPALLTAYQITTDSAYLHASERAFHFYMRGFLTDGFTAAGALDTHCIDKESAIPLLNAGLTLYEITGNAQYLKWSEHAAYYLASWQWHHSVSYPVGTPLHDLAYDTFGGTSVSTQHHHQDPYGLAFVMSWLKLSELTGKSIWKERAQAVWANGMIGVSDGQLRIMEKVRPIGSQDEGFYHTRWGKPFGVSQWLVAWPTAFRLEILRRLTDWSVLNHTS